MNYPYKIWKWLNVLYIYRKPFSFSGYTLFPWVVLIDPNHKDNERLIRHEHIHSLQMLDWVIPALIVLFFSWKLAIITLFGQPIIIGLNYVLLRIKHNHYYSYRMLLMEQEAYLNQEKEDYLKTRIPFYWIKYLFAGYVFNPVTKEYKSYRK